jgi:hypothetical protein
VIEYLEDRLLPEDNTKAKRVVLEAGQMEVSNGLLLQFW